MWGVAVPQEIDVGTYPSVRYTHWRRIIFGRHGESRTTFGNVPAPLSGSDVCPLAWTKLCRLYQACVWLFGCRSESVALA